MLIDEQSELDPGPVEGVGAASAASSPANDVPDAAKAAPTPVLLDPDFFAKLTPTWQRNCALRTDYGRRQALLKIDVLVARALGLTFIRPDREADYRVARAFFDHRHGSTTPPSES